MAPMDATKKLGSIKFGGLINARHPKGRVLSTFVKLIVSFVVSATVVTQAQDLDNPSSSFWSERISAAEYKENPEDLNRLKNAHTAYLSFGTPAPSLLAFNLGTQLDEQFQILLSYGQFWADDLRIHSLEAAVRLHLFKTDFTPMIGAGINTLLFRGTGNIQTLSESSLLVSMLLGIDWAMNSKLRISTGFSFHLPLRLNFPFVNAGLSF
jgi:hypothetical protein